MTGHPEPDRLEPLREAARGLEKARAVIDQVARKQRFMRDHPGVRIDHLTAPSWHWRARWMDAGGTARELASHELGALLDMLGDAPDGPPRQDAH